MSNTPSKIGKYAIESLIAKGGMGEVYKGKHPTLNRDVILKKLTIQGNGQFIERFNREARIMMDFKHDNIVNVYDHFKEGDSHYIVLEYVDGEALDCFILRERYLPNELALYIVSEVSKALKYAHDKGVVHRDIKPGNILISKTGEIKLVDFGIAVSEDEADQDLTKIGVTLGTPSYMAPEQFENSKNVDKRADIYSVGVMLYEMVTGKKPYPSGMSPELIANIQKGRHTSAKKINPKVNNKVLSLIKKLMQPNPNKRIQDLETVIDKLKRFFKKHSQELFKMRISDSVLGRELVPLPEKKKNKWILPTIITCLVLAGAGYFVLKGYHNEYFLSGSKGALRVNVSVDKKYYKEVDEIFLKSKLFKEVEGSPKHIKGVDLDFFINKEQPGDFNIFKSKKIYLDEGFYRLKMMVDGNLIWKNFQIKPGKIQKSNAHTSNGLLVDIVHTQQKQLPFYPSIKVKDQTTGEEITKNSVIYIKKNNKFVNFDPNDKTLKTGEIQYFQVSKKGYYLKEFILKVSPDQTDLTLDVELYPKPGLIKVLSNQQGIKVKINGNTNYIKGDLTQEKVKLEKLGVEESVFTLNPGTHTVLFTYKGNSVEKEIEVESGKEYNISIKYNKENKSLSF